MARTAKIQTKLNLMRLQRDISRAELAEKAGVSERSIQLWETGARNFAQCKYSTVYRISEVLNCLCEDIVDIDKSSQSVL